MDIIYVIILNEIYNHSIADISIVFITKKESFNNPNPKPVFDFDKLVEYGLSQKVYNFIHGSKGPKGIDGLNAPDPQNLDDYLDS